MLIQTLAKPQDKRQQVMKGLTEFNAMLIGESQSFIKESVKAMKAG